MDRKLKDLVKPDENALLDAVCGSAHQIWQAGLGAFARAQQEGGELFDKLVQEGGELQKLTQRLTGEKGFSVTDTVTRLAENASRQASGSWDKLEKVFEERVSRSMRALGVPPPGELKLLSSEVAQMKDELRKLAQASRGELEALGRSVAELKAALDIAGNKQAAKKALAGPAPKAAAKAPARTAAKSAVAKSAAAKSAAAKRPAAKKTARSASRAG